MHFGVKKPCYNNSVDPHIKAAERRSFLFTKEAICMNCPYIHTVVQDNQDTYEYNDEGNQTSHTHRLVESRIPAKCAEGECAAWQGGRCRYNE